jgi:hypothetical protein
MTSLKKLARYKHSSLSCQNIGDEGKKYVALTPVVDFINFFTLVIYSCRKVNRTVHIVITPTQYSHNGQGYSATAVSYDRNFL